MLSRLAPQHVPVVLSPDLIRCVVNNLSGEKNFLHKAACGLTEALGKIAQERMWMRIAILAQLANNVSHFDRVTKSNTVDTLLGGLDTAGVEEYVAHLQGLFLDCSGIAAEPRSTVTDPVSAHRIWVVDQLLALVKHHRVPKTEAWLMDVSEFMLKHGFFSWDETLASPPLSDSVTKVCRDRFVSLLAELSVMAPPHLAVPGERAPRALDGTTKDGMLWVWHLTQVVDKTRAEEGAALMVDLGEEQLAVRSKALAVVEGIHKQTKKRAKGNKAAVGMGPQSRAWELLLLQMGMQQLVEPTESTSVLEELMEVHARESQPETKTRATRGKKKAEEEEEEEEEEVESCALPLSVRCGSTSTVC